MVVYGFEPSNAGGVRDGPPEGRLAPVRATFRDFPAWAATALDGFTGAARLHFGPIREVVSPAGRVLLIGDAAHACSPILPQGGDMALEDAPVRSSVRAEAPSADGWDGVLDAFVARRLRAWGGYAGRRTAGAARESPTGWRGRRRRRGHPRSHRTPPRGLRFPQGSAVRGSPLERGSMPCRALASAPESAWQR